jgi:hypothetical protein
MSLYTRPLGRADSITISDLRHILEAGASNQRKIPKAGNSTRTRRTRRGLITNARPDEPGGLQLSQQSPESLRWLGIAP